MYLRLHFYLSLSKPIIQTYPMRQDLSVNLLTCIHSWILQYSSGGHHTFEYDIYKFHQHLIIISILSLLDVSVKSTCSVKFVSDKHLFCHIRCHMKKLVTTHQPHILLMHLIIQAVLLSAFQLSASYCIEVSRPLWSSVN